MEVGLAQATLEDAAGNVIVAGEAWLNPERAGLATFYPFGDQAPKLTPSPTTLRTESHTLAIVYHYPCPAPAVPHYHLGYDPRP